MGSPSIFVYDCSNAGIIVKSFKQFALQREQELEVSSSRDAQDEWGNIPAAKLLITLVQAERPGSRLRVHHGT